jgi:hypothetical protein
MAEAKKVNFLTKLYIWSVVMEPLLFFIVFDQATTGITGNVSRILQFFVVVLVFIRLIVSGRQLRIPNPFVFTYRYYALYFCCVILAGIIGILQGAYVLNEVYEKQGGFTFVSKLINGIYTRPLFEYFITGYYFLYFSILPMYLIKTREGINYFFKLFFYSFILCLILGYIDFILIAVFNIEFIPRHLVDGFHPGMRFHGLAGEPRDAFVYLLYALAVMNLKIFWEKREMISTKWIILIFITLILTQSASGLLGLLFSGVLILVFGGNGFSVKKAFRIFLIVVALFIIAYIGAESSDRIMFYIKVFPDVWQAINEQKEIPLIFLGQMSNIYPVWDLFNNVLNFNLIPITIGRGLGTASIISNRLGGVSELFNPHSQLIRILYESGTIGIILFIYAFVHPTRILTKHLSMDQQKRFLLLLLILIGAFFGQRSSSLYIYLGIFLLVFQLLENEEQTHKSNAVSI